MSLGSCTPPELFEAANDAAWDAVQMLSQSAVWTAVYEWGGFNYENPPPDDTAITLYVSMSLQQASLSPGDRPNPAQLAVEMLRVGKDSVDVRRPVGSSVGQQ